MDAVVGHEEHQSLFGVGVSRRRNRLRQYGPSQQNSRCEQACTSQSHPLEALVQNRRAAVTVTERYSFVQRPHVQSVGPHTGLRNTNPLSGKAPEP